MKIYDNNYDEEIDIEELINKRDKFNEELDKVKEIVDAIKKLENKVIDYKQDKSVDKEEEEEKIEKDKEAPKTNEQFFRETINELNEQIQIDKKMKGEVKKFFYANIDQKTKNFVLLDEAPWQSW